MDSIKHLIQIPHFKETFHLNTEIQRIYKFSFHQADLAWSIRFESSTSTRHSQS